MNRDFKKKTKEEDHRELQNVENGRELKCVITIYSITFYRKKRHSRVVNGHKGRGFLFPILLLPLDCIVRHIKGGLD